MGGSNWIPVRTAVDGTSTFYVSVRPLPRHIMRQGGPSPQEPKQYPEDVHVIESIKYFQTHDRASSTNTTCQIGND